MENLNSKLNSFKGNIDVESSLKKEFNEALKDKDFKEFVSKLKMSPEVLCKYTSRLQESFEEYSNCKKCKSIHECKNPVTGYVLLPEAKGGKINFYYGACRFTKKINKETEHLKNVYFLDIPKEIREASMKEIFTTDNKRYEVVEWITKFAQNYKKDPHQKGLYLSGNFGVGKTYLVAALFNKLAASNHKSAIVYWPEFLRDLKASFGNYNSDFNYKFNQVKKAELLLLDDIGAETTTAWARDEIFGPILQYRMQAKLPTFFTSNLDLKQLENHLSVTKDSVDIVKAKRIVERIKQLTDRKEMITKNLRK